MADHRQIVLSFDRGPDPDRRRIFSGAAYGRLFKSDFGKKGPTDFSAVAPIDYRQGLDPNVAQNGINVAARLFADCVARAAPANSERLSSSAGSPAGTRRRRSTGSSLRRAIA